jgi:hypothetical protein
MIWSRGATIEELLAGCTPTVGRLVEASRKRILSVVPGSTEKLRRGWGLIGYNAPAYFAFIDAGRDAVRIGFEWGVLLTDPGGLLEGSGSQVRYVRVTTTQSLRSPALAALLLEAAAIRPSAKPRRASWRRR